MFATSDGKPIRWTNLRRRQFRTAVQGSVGQPCVSHDLRHTHAALCIAQNIHPKVLQARLGHSSISITMDTYGGLFSGFDSDVADALDDAFSTRSVSDLRQIPTSDVSALPSQ